MTLSRIFASMTGAGEERPSTGVGTALAFSDPLMILSRSKFERARAVASAKNRLRLREILDDDAVSRLAETA
jgi:hypothetical protein